MKRMIRNNTEISEISQNYKLLRWVDSKYRKMKKFIVSRKV